MTDDIIHISGITRSGDIKVFKPLPTDTPAATSLKMFSLACVLRGSIDDDFQIEMMEWLKAHEPEAIGALN